MPTKKSHTTEPDTGSIDGSEELIRLKAFGYYEKRGYEDGHDLDDWLRAEAEIVGHKAGEFAVADEKREAAAVAA
jgi:hypothetical protein